MVAITATLGLAETGAATDSLPIEVPILDNAIGGEQPLALFIPSNDSGTITETITTQASFNMADAGAGSEAPIIWLYFNDQSYRHNAPAGEQNLYESGIGTEGFLIEVDLNVGDVGSALDVLSVQSTFNVADSGLAAETTTILLMSFDVGAGADVGASQASFIVNDVGVIYELFSKDFTILEAAQGGDRFAVRVLQKGRLHYVIKLRVTENVFDPFAFDPYAYE